MPASPSVVGLCKAAPVLASACLLLCCSPAKERKPLPNWSAGYDKSVATPGGSSAAAQSGSVQFGRHSDLPDTGMGIVISDEVTWPMRIRELDSAATPCSVHGTMDGKTHEIQCVIDMDELDLWTEGLTFDLVVPAGECDFILTHYYKYENFEVGVGPTDVSWKVQADGTITDEVNARDGKPFCKYDYKSQSAASENAPNCCLGSYTQKVTNAMGGVMTTHDFWDGKPGDCYDGAAYRDVEAKLDDAGFPVDHWIYLGRDPLLKTVKFKGLSESYGANVPLASFYRPSEHNGDMPVSFKGEFATPLYEIECTDDAKEEISLIQITVREWNEEAQFDVDRDPDTTGTEPGWNTPIDDIPDWDVLTPDNTTYPRLKRPK